MKAVIARDGYGRLKKPARNQFILLCTRWATRNCEMDTPPGEVLRDDWLGRALERQEVWSRANVGRALNRRM